MRIVSSAIRSLLVSALFISLQVWYFPRWVGIRGRWDAAADEPWRWLGIAPLAGGSALMLACVWRFGTTGEGTPAPFDPPRRFVAVGPYRYVRNPMYLGMALALIGEGALFAERSSLGRILWYGLALAAITQCFVLLYEEPTLRRKFGGVYEEYCRSVNRWLPAIRRLRSTGNG